MQREQYHNKNSFPLGRSAPLCGFLNDNRKYEIKKTFKPLFFRSAGGLSPTHPTRKGEQGSTIPPQLLEEVGMIRWRLEEVASNIISVACGKSGDLEKNVATRFKSCGLEPVLKVEQRMDAKNERKEDEDEDEEDE